MSEYAQILREQLAQLKMGSAITIFLTNGSEISGMVVNTGSDHVVLRKGGRTRLISINMIGTLDLPDEEFLAPKVEQANSTSPHMQPVAGSTPMETSTDPSTQMRSFIEPEVRGRLIEIIAFFDGKTQAAKIDLLAPDLKALTEELKRAKQRDALALWSNIKQKYEYAIKVKDLDSPYRMQSIIGDLKALIEVVPTLPSVRRLLAYFQFIIGKIPEAIKSYQEVSFISHATHDWHNVAALALKADVPALVCYSLEQVFKQTPIEENADIWYVYVASLKKSGDYALLGNFYDIGRRKLSEREEQLLLETSIYLLKCVGKEATALELMSRWLAEVAVTSLAQEACKHLAGSINDAYRQVLAQAETVRRQVLSLLEVTGQQNISPSETARSPILVVPTVETARPSASSVPPITPPLNTGNGGEMAQGQLEGRIYTYKKRNYGFLRGADGGNYFFHRSAITDEDLLTRLKGLSEATLSSDEQIPVTFEATRGPNGQTVAVGVSLQRATDEMFAIAVAYADEGEYAKAITQIRKVLARDLNYPEAQALYEKWSEYDRASLMPRGSNPFDRAKRVQMVEKDPERAVQIYYQAIEENDHVEAAIKQLVSLLMQREHPKEVITLIEQHRHRLADQQYADTALIHAYQKLGQYTQAIQILQKNLSTVISTATKGRQVHLRWQIASNYLKLGDYVNAETWFQEVLTVDPENRAAQQNIAFCLIKQERYVPAEQILRTLLPDTQAAELLEAISKARVTGESVQIDDITTEMMLTDFSGEISGFTSFFLARCVYEGVPPIRMQEKNFDRNDVKRLEELATRQGRARPRERAEYYMSAAKIIVETEEWEDPDQLHKYLYRSFASRGDAAVLEMRHPDVARAFYCEALSVYDHDRSVYDHDRSREEERDAVNALIRYLFTTIGYASVPMSPDLPPLEKTLERILNTSSRTKVFDAIAYLVAHSRYAANRILGQLHALLSFQAMTLDYLKSKSITVPSGKIKPNDFVSFWDQLQRRSAEEARTAMIELRFIGRVDLTTASVESSLGRLKEVERSALFDLDRQRVGQLQKILEMMLDLCKQLAFEEQERFCTQIDNRCQYLLNEIAGNPTRLSVEALYPIITTIREKTAEYLEKIYASSAPQIVLALPKDFESYFPSPAMNNIEVQIVVRNKMGSSPAESLELVVQGDKSLFSVDAQETKLGKSLRGGEQEILIVPIRVTEQALRSQAFSLSVCAKYRTRSGEIARTAFENFSIHLYAQPFEEIKNPYAEYAQGGIVGEKDMFYGRGELINKVATVICEAHSQSKSIMIYGEKRAGKSSVLHHLSKELAKDPDLLVLDLGSLGGILDDTEVSLLRLFLGSILIELEFAIEDEVRKGRSQLQISFPNSIEFYEHPASLVYFQELLTRFNRAAANAQDWQGVRIVLLIDEFSYLYDLSVKKRLPEDFMKNWKALLQQNLFSVVLVGQDGMLKFKQLFPNEFAVMQDERVNYLHPDDAVKLIDEPIRIGNRSGESRYREKAIARIVDLTAGSPFYIQIICNRLVEYMNSKRATLVTEAYVEQVKNELIQGVNPLNWGHFDNLISSGDTSPDAISNEDTIKVLSMIALNSRIGSCSRSSITCHTQTDVDAILKDLEDRQVIESKQGQYYKIRVGLFKEWLIAHQ